MSTMNQFRQGQQQTWEHLAEGWRHITERAGGALTCFHQERQAVEGPGMLVERYAPRWGLVAAELREETDTLVVKLEVPGMNPEQIGVDVVDDFLVVRGEKRVQREDARGRYHLLECAYGNFERAIPLPMAVEASRARARYHHGVLTVILPKRDRTDAEAVRRIKVNAE